MDELSQSCPAHRGFWLALVMLLGCSIAIPVRSAVPPLSHQDIGAVGAKGSYASSGTTMAIKGSGADIWSVADGFQFAYLPLTGDGSVTVRVATQTNTHAWAKAGIMFRESLAAGARHAMVAVTPGNGAIIQSRATTGSPSVSIHGPKVKAPYWLRMVRAGNVYTAYVSADGAAWKRLGSYTLQMNSQLYVGLAVSSHVKGVLSTATFDNLATGAVATPVTSVTPVSALVPVGGTRQFTASSAAGGALTWQVNGITGGNASVGTISSAGLYKAPASVPSPGSVTVLAVPGADSTRAGTAVVTITAAASGKPTISGAPPVNATVGQAYAFTPTVTNPSGTKLTFKVANLPAWATFSTTSGALSGTPATDDIGTYANIMISASDGTTAIALPAFTITVRGGVTGSATLRWTAPTTRTDGTALTNLAGYRIYYGTAPASYTQVIDVRNPGLTTYVIDNLPAGTYYFTCAAYDSKAVASAYSAQVSKVVR